MIQQTSGPYRWAALFLTASAVLHLIAPAFAGFTTMSFVLLGFSVIYMICVAGLNRGMRWLAYIVFIWMLIIGLVIMPQIWSPAGMPSLWTLGVLVANWLTAAALFVALWRPALSKAD